jgi:ubiquinone/menaquinone biosynthesis C-methylase UbiE
MSEREQAHAARIREQFTKQAEPFAALAIHTHGSSLELLREGLALRGTERVLDAGCGPGLVVRYLAPFVQHIVGVDATPAMLEKARAVLAEQKLENVEFVAGDMESLPFPDHSFDAVVTRYTFHHLLAPERAMAELARVCRPGGRVVVCDATPRPDARDAYDAWERVRDASHTSARTEAELLALARAQLGDCSVRRFRLESRVLQLLESCFPADADGLHARMAADVGSDALDMAAAWDGPALMMSFPVSVISGTRP